MIDYMVYAAYFVVGFFIWWSFNHQILNFMVGCEYTTPIICIVVLGMSVIFGVAYSSKLLGSPNFFVATCIGGLFALLFEGVCYDWKKWRMKKVEDEGAKAGLSES